MSRARSLYTVVPWACLSLAAGQDVADSRTLRFEEIHRSEGSPFDDPVFFGWGPFHPGMFQVMAHDDPFSDVDFARHDLIAVALGSVSSGSRAEITRVVSQRTAVDPIGYVDVLLTLTDNPWEGPRRPRPLLVVRTDYADQPEIFQFRPASWRFRLFLSTPTGQVPYFRELTLDTPRVKTAVTWDGGLVVTRPGRPTLRGQATPTQLDTLRAAFTTADTTALHGRSVGDQTNDKRRFRLRTKLADERPEFDSQQGEYSFTGSIGYYDAAPQAGDLVEAMWTITYESLFAVRGPFTELAFKREPYAAAPSDRVLRVNANGLVQLVRGDGLAEVSTRATEEELRRLNFAWTASTLGELPETGTFAPGEEAPRVTVNSFRLSVQGQFGATQEFRGYMGPPWAASQRALEKVVEELDQVQARLEGGVSQLGPFEAITVSVRQEEDNATEYTLTVRADGTADLDDLVDSHTGLTVSPELMADLRRGTAQADVPTLPGDLLPEGGMPGSLWESFSLALTARDAEGNPLTVTTHGTLDPPHGAYWERVSLLATTLDRISRSLFVSLHAQDTDEPEAADVGILGGLGAAPK